MRNRRLKNTISMLVVLAMVLGFSVPAQAVPGDPDESYGTTGFYFDNLPNTGNQESTVFLDGELTADGKLTSVGVFSYFVPGFAHAQDLYVQRLLPNGSRDPSLNAGSGFPGNGNAPGSVRFTNLLPIASQFIARAVRIQQDNKIVIAGVCNIVTGFGTPNGNQSGYGMCAARLLPSGALDTSFGGNMVQVRHLPNDPDTWFNFTMPAGTTFVHYPGQVESGYSGAFAVVRAAAYDVAIHSDGRIVLVGKSVFREFNGNFFLGYNNVAMVVTLTPSGALSSRDIVPPIQSFEAARRTDGRTLTKVETQSDGSVVAVGFETFVDPVSLVPIANRWLAYTGSISGNVTWTSENLPRDSHATSVKFTRGNKIMVGGFQSTDGEIRAVLMRFNGNNLVPDATFGNGGKIAYCRVSMCDEKYYLAAIAMLRLESIQNDGKILALGGEITPHRFPLSSLGGDRLFRFNPDGSIDRSFGDAGFTHPQFLYNYGYNYLNRLSGVQIVEAAGYAVLQADGKILSGGAYNSAGGQANRAGVTRRQNTFRRGIFSDFDNDGRADLAFFRNGTWSWINSFSRTTSTVQLGTATDSLAPADYDGDGRTDTAVFRDGTWSLIQSSDNQNRTVQFGQAGDIPRPGDFNGDGQADFGLFRPSNATWYVLLSNPIQPGDITQLQQQFGASGDTPVVGDFDRDGKTDYATFRNGTWSHLRSTDGQTVTVQLGQAGDIPVPGDYDGDSLTDQAVFRPSNAVWLIQRSSDGQTVQEQFGQAGDTPVPEDYDRDGRDDLAVYRNGTWTIRRSSDGTTTTATHGTSGDLPLGAAYSSGGGAASTLQFNAANYSVQEDTTAVSLTVTRTGATSGAATIDYATTDGTATAGRDYAATSGTLSFGAGETSKTFTVLISEDSYVEGDETFTLTLSNPTGTATLGAPNVATVTIVDDASEPGTNPIEDAQTFVRQHYHDFLGREPDAGGLSYWTDQITQCGSDANCIRQRRLAVSNAFFFELEYQQTGAYVYRLYRAAFGNNQPFPNPGSDGDPIAAAHVPSYAAFNQDRNQVIGGADLAQSSLNLASNFVQRPAFTQRYPASQTGAEFVDAVLATIQSSSGANLTNQRDALINQFNMGGRGAVLYRVAEDSQTNPINNRAFLDAEYNRSFVLTQYFGYLRRDPDMGGINFWFGVINRFPLRSMAGQQTMVCVFITSAEYQLRFGPQVPRSNPECSSAP